MYFHLVVAFLCSCLQAEQPQQLTYDFWLEGRCASIFSASSLVDASFEAYCFIENRMQRIARNDSEKKALHPAIALLESCWMSGDSYASQWAFDIINDYYQPASQESLLFQMTGFQWGNQKATGRNELAYQRGRVQGAVSGESVHKSFQIPGLKRACQTYPLVRDWATFFVKTDCEPDWMWDAKKKPWEFNEGRSLKEGLVPDEESERKWLCQALDSIAPQWVYSLCSYISDEQVQNLLKTAVSLEKFHAQITMCCLLLNLMRSSNDVSADILDFLVQFPEEARLRGNFFAAANLGMAFLDNEKARVCYGKMYPEKDPIMLSVDWLSSTPTIKGADVLRRHLVQNTLGVRESRTKWLEKNKHEIAGHKSDEPILWAQYFLLMDSWDDNRFGCVLVINEDGLRTAMCEISGKNEKDLIEVGVRALIEENKKRNIVAAINLAYYFLVDQLGVRSYFKDSSKWVQRVFESLLGEAERGQDRSVNRLKELTDDQISGVLGSCDEASRSSLKKRLENIRK